MDGDVIERKNEQEADPIQTSSQANKTGESNIYKILDSPKKLIHSPIFKTPLPVTDTTLTAAPLLPVSHPRHNLS